MGEYSILFIRTEDDSTGTAQPAIAGAFDGHVEWVCVEALFDGLRTLQERSFDLILADLFLDDSKGLNTLRDLKKEAPQSPVIALCHSEHRHIGVLAVRNGAHDFFCYEDLNAASLRRSVTQALASDAGLAVTNRRSNARFPCRLAVSYQALEHPFFSGQATSETVNISSKGILFAVTEPLQTGQLLQLSVDWPARLENEVALKLVAEGRVMRIVEGQAAVRIEKYEFRTRRNKAQPTGAGVRGQR